MAPPKDRKRKFHRRSKNGCQTCKQRHVRCDERKPLCTSCLHSGNECIYPSQGDETPCPSNALAVYGGSPVSVKTEFFVNHSLNDYMGGIFDALPESSKTLLRHYAVYSVQGQQPVNRDSDLSVIHKAVGNSGYMHMCLVLAACQWAWVTGSMDDVALPFLHHKSGAYRFVREQLLQPETARSRETILAISTLALAEAAVGDLDTSTKHLKGFRIAMQSSSAEPSLPQKMLRSMCTSLRTANALATQVSQVNMSEYQPTFLALLFASIWDITTLPPTAAPKYGWWEGTDSQAACLWQMHTKHLNLNYELSRGFDPNTYKPRILNGDPRSSRTCFIATFFYLVFELGIGQMDSALVEWLLEQLVDDINACEQSPDKSFVNGPLWLWCVLFSAAIAESGRVTDAIEMNQQSKWKLLYKNKLVIVNEALGISSWDVAQAILSNIVKISDDGVDEELRRLWEEGTSWSAGNMTAHVTDCMI